jgi:hypothetical protein
MDRCWKDHVKVESPSPAKAECLYPAAPPLTALDALRERESSRNAPESRADAQVMRAGTLAIRAEEALRRAIETASKTPAPVTGLKILFDQSALSSSDPSDATLETNPGVQDESNKSKDESNNQQEQLTDWHVQGPQRETSVASELVQSSDTLFKDGEYMGAGTGDVKEERTDFCAVETASSSFESSSSSSSLHKESATSTNVLHASTPPARGGRCQTESTSIKVATGRIHSVPFVTSLCSGRQHF